MEQRITKITSQLFGLTLISRILGLIRDLALAWFIGAGGLGDIFACALRLPHLARRLLQEGLLSLTLIGALLKLKKSAASCGQAQEAEEIFFSRIARLIGIILSLSLLLGYVFAADLAKILAPNFPAEKQANLTNLIGISLPYLLFVGLNALWMARLHAAKLFLVPAALPILLNLTILLALGLAYIFDLPYPISVLWAMSLAGLGQWLWQKITFLRHEKKFSLANLKVSALFKRCKAKKLDACQALSQTYNPKVARTIWAIPLGLLASSAQHLLLLVAMIFLSGLGEGQVAAQFYAERILELPLGLIAVSLGLASLPILTQLATQAKWLALTRQLSQAIHLAWLLIVPATLGLLAVSQTLVSVLFGHGEFDAAAMSRTTQILVAYLPIIPAATFNRLLLSGCLALDGLKFAAQSTLLVLSLALGLSLSDCYPPYVAVGCLYLETLLLGLWLKIHLAKKKTKIILAKKTLGKSTLAAIIACSLAYLIVELNFIPASLSLLLAILTAITIWGLLLKYTSQNDWRRLKKLLTKKRNKAVDAA